MAPQQRTQDNGPDHASDLGDVLQVLHRLAPDDPETVSQMLRCLGHRPATPLPERNLFSVAEERQDQSSDNSAQVPSEPARPSSSEPQSAGVSETSAEERAALPSTLIALGEAGAGAPPDWLYEVEPWAHPQDFQPAYRQQIDPLIDPRRARALLQRILSTRVPRGAIDMRRMVRQVARCMPLGGLPRHLRDRMGPGVQVLLDNGPAMAPFLTDMHALARDVVGVVGFPASEIRFFANAPKRGVMSPDIGLWEDYVLPVPGRPVLVVTDLGGVTVPGRTDRPAGIEEWVALAEVLTRRGSDLTFLVPGNCAVAGHFTNLRVRFLIWDRGLGQRDVRRAAGCVRP